MEKYAHVTSLTNVNLNPALNSIFVELCRFAKLFSKNSTMYCQVLV